MNAIHHQARMAGQQSAIRLMAFADAVWPQGKMLDFVVEEVLSEAVVFAVNARRVLDDLGTSNVVQQSDWVPVAGEKPSAETDLRRCLNTVIHASELKVRVATANRSRFIDEDNVQLVSLVGDTDRHSNVNIDLFGMAWAFISLPKEATIN